MVAQANVEGMLLELELADAFVAFSSERVNGNGPVVGQSAAASPAPEEPAPEEPVTALSIGVVRGDAGDAGGGGGDRGGGGGEPRRADYSPQDVALTGATASTAHGDFTRRHWATAAVTLVEPGDRLVATMALRGDRSAVLESSPVSSNGRKKNFFS